MKRFISLAEANPDLSLEWHPTKNGELTPYLVSANSHKKVWWLLPYDDPKTGKHFDFEWEAKIDNRNKGRGCPFLVGQAIYVGYNDLATVNPTLAKEWNYEKNKGLTPQDITANSNRNVWWVLHHTDKRTGLDFIFEWEADVRSRHHGAICPYLLNRLLYVGFNDLETVCPELAKEFDAYKNGFKASEILFGSHKHVWWRCNKGHSWRTTVDKRYHEKTGCPHCAKEFKTSMPERIVYYYIKKNFHDAISGDRCAIGAELDIYVPSRKIAIEYDGCAWHQYVEKDINKDKLCRDNNIKLIRIREDGCPSIDDGLCKIFHTMPNNHKSLRETVCAVLAFLGLDADVNFERDSTDILSMIEYLKKQNSLLEMFPNVAAEWHPTKNGNLTPLTVTAKSGQIVWWLINHCDEKSGQTIVFEWRAAICDRTIRGDGCPYLSGAKIHPEFNSLLALNPSLASEWNMNKNEGLVNGKGEDISTPDKVSPGSHQKVWWKCCKCAHEWIDSIEKRNLGRLCPKCKLTIKSTKLKHSDIEI